MAVYFSTSYFGFPFFILQTIICPRAGTTPNWTTLYYRLDLLSPYSGLLSFSWGLGFLPHCNYRNSSTTDTKNLHLWCLGVPCSFRNLFFVPFRWEGPFEAMVICSTIDCLGFFHLLGALFIASLALFHWVDGFNELMEEKRCVFEYDYD